MRKLSSPTYQACSWLLGLALMGCAKYPDVPEAASTRLIFSMTVSGAIRTGQEPGGTGVPYIYMVAMRTSEDDIPTTGGPIPVIAPPWGNGYVAGNATHFVWWDPTATDDYLLYKFLDVQLNNRIIVGVPISVENVGVGSQRIRFELLLTQLVDDPLDAADLRSLQVNFLTMDRIPQSGSNKQWDALGNNAIPSEINSYVRVPLGVNGIYNNQSANNLEPTGDQANPDLDISDWSVEVRIE
ncbi:MAG: hypothetical protein IT205_06420 [Fimbriimonadaceae bacterium]|nr:hypothetical protein [Fimbriimonadaceae bacterium]